MRHLTRQPDARYVRVTRPPKLLRRDRSNLELAARMIVPLQDLPDGTEDQVSGSRVERTVDHLGVEPAQILADERLGDRPISELGGEPIDGCLGLGAGPIISNAVAETEMPLQSKLVGTSLIILEPVVGLPQHQGFHRGREAVFDRRRNEHACDAVESVERFTHRKRQPGADLQNRETVSDQRDKAGCGLIVCRVRFEDKARQTRQSVNQADRLFRLVRDDFGAGELDAWLHQRPDRAREGRLEANIPERLLMNFDCVKRRVVEAAKMLDSEWDVPCEVWSATSYSELARDAREAERRNKLNPLDEPVVSHLGACLPPRSSRRQTMFAPTRR